METMPATSHSRVLGMTHRNDLFSYVRLLTPAIIGLTFAMSNAEALETLGRYTTVNPHAQTVVRDLLAVPVSVEFPQSITVGDAVARVLQDTGYSLSPATAAADERSALLLLPLPPAHRTLDVPSVRLALQTLVGPAFTVIEDPIHRLVSFERCRAADPANAGMVVQP